MRDITLGSLFDGSGGFPAAGSVSGIRPVWASEIEPYPLKVTAVRYPKVEQLGDVTKIDGAKIAPVDIITFGSPCQDLSVAGQQKGIHAGERSNLFFEAIRIIKEMRDADTANGRTGERVRPRFAVWENVPGAFSSNKGEDFKAVLEALAGVRQSGLHIPRPKKWSHAGLMVGDEWSIAWRVYDAQYWGVPQRRKRIYLVADFAGECAGEILFEREGLCGNPAESGKAREGTAADAEGGAGGGCISFAWANSAKAGLSDGVVSPTIKAARGGEPAVAAFMGGQSARGDTSPCVGSGQNMVCVQNTGRGWWNEGEIAETLRTPCGGDSTKANLVVALDCRNIVGNVELSGTLQAKNDGGYSLNYQNPIVYDARGNGDGKTAPTLTGDHQNRVTDYTSIVVSSSGNGIAATLDASCYKGPGARNGKEREYLAVVYPGVGITSPQNGNNPSPGDPAPSLTSDSRNYHVARTKPPRKYIIRRLTPLECCRLQGFPDWWEDGVDGSDSARYKMWGNGIALPCAVDVLNRIARKELGV